MEIPEKSEYHEYDDYSYIFGNEIFIFNKYRKDFIAINKKTRERFILGYVQKDRESYSSNLSKISNKTRAVYHFTWNKDEISKIVGRSVSIGKDKELQHTTGNRQAITITMLKNTLKELFDKKS